MEMNSDGASTQTVELINPNSSRFNSFSNSKERRDWNQLPLRSTGHTHLSDDQSSTRHGHLHTSLSSTRRATAHNVSIRPLQLSISSVVEASNRPDFSVSSDKIDLCRHCQRLEFNYGINNDQWINLNRCQSLGPIHPTSSCPCCRFLWSKRLQDSPSACYSLVKYPIILALPVLHKTMQAKHNNKAGIRSKLGFMAVVPTEHAWDMKPRALTHAHCIFGLPIDDSNDAEYENSWIAEPGAKVNMSIPKHWLESCRKNHGPGCNLKRIANPNMKKGFKLIDCDTGRIISSSLDVEYVALSYVWGNTMSTEHVSWPRTILDSMEVTLGLGFRYLWVDRYCIGQDNESEKHSQISNMDSIYRMAEVTIIAAAGSDADRGLPGIGSKKRKTLDHSRTGPNANTILFTISGDADEEVLNSTWSTRGWTYQEGVLSRRRLIFTDSQMIFECSANRRYENIPMDLDEWTTSDPELLQGILNKPLLGLSQGWQLLPSNQGHPPIDHRDIIARKLAIIRQKTAQKDLVRQVRKSKLVDMDGHIQRYCERKLRYPSDALNAFMGILRFSEMSSFFGLGIIWNDTKAMFAVSLIRWQRFSATEPSQGSTVSRMGGDDLEETGRVGELPSWSWVGWHGEVDFIEEAVFLAARRPAHIKFQNLTGGYLSLQEIPRNTAGDDWSTRLSQRIFIEHPDIFTSVRSADADLRVCLVNSAKKRFDADFYFEGRLYKLELRMCGTQTLSPEAVIEDLRYGRIEALRLLEDWFLLVRLICDKSSSDEVYRRIGTIYCDMQQLRGRAVPQHVLSKSERRFCIA